MRIPSRIFHDNALPRKNVLTGKNRLDIFFFVALKPGSGRCRYIYATKVPFWFYRHLEFLMSQSDRAVAVLLGICD